MKIEMKLKLALLAASLSLTAAGAAQATTVATIDGSYDVCSFDTPCLTFHNTSGGTFVNAQIVLRAYNGRNNGIVQTVNLGTIGAGDSNVVWNGPGPLFSNDYDDSLGGVDPCVPNPVNSGLCANVGNFSVTFTATISGGVFNGQAVFSVFSPDSNQTGGFVGWEGLNPLGQSEDPAYDVHTGAYGGVLAVINLGVPPSVPEPATLALLGLGLAGLGFSRRKKA